MKSRVSCAEFASADGGWVVWRLMLKCITIGVLTCKLRNLLLSVLPRLKSSLSSGASLSHSPLRAIGLKNIQGSLICWFNLPPLFYFITVVTLVSLFNSRTAHWLYLRLTHLLLYQRNPRCRVSIFNESSPQRFQARACNYGQWSVVIKERIQLSETSWEPGGE